MEIIMCGFSKVWQLSREGMAACNNGDFFTAENNLKTAIAMAKCKSKKSTKQQCITIWL